MGRRPQEQQEAWVATGDLPRSPGHPFYEHLNRLLSEAGFDTWLEGKCACYYVEETGRPSIPPGVYFRMILAGYFEGIASQRGIAWKCGDSLSLRAFLGIPLQERTPDHSSLTRVHQRLPLKVHEEMFQFVLKIAAEKGLMKGKTVVVDATTLEANAAMKSLVRKDTGEEYEDYLRRLAAEAGLENPTAEELRRFDRQRDDKKMSNAEWESKTDKDSRITKMKDKTTHMGYKAEHVVDEETDLVLAATVHGGDAADTATLGESVQEAQKNIEAAHEMQQVDNETTAGESPAAESETDTRETSSEGNEGADDEPTEGSPTIEEVAADKGYHSAETIAQCEEMGLRTYVPEPKRKGRRSWKKRPKAHKKAVYGNRRRIRGNRGKRLQKRRSELTERSFAHVCETGGGRRCWLHGLEKVTKRYLIQVAARNLGRVMRHVTGIGTPRSLQDLSGLINAMTRVILRSLNRENRPGNQENAEMSRMYSYHVVLRSAA